MAKEIPFQTAFGAHRQCDFINDGVSLTKQSESAECDLNAIMKRYEKTGLLTHVNERQPQPYADYTDVLDYQESVNRINQANESFNALPAEVRKKFANDPAQLIRFVSDEANRDEAEKLGLVTKKIVEATPDIRADSENSEAPKTSST